MAEKLYKPEEYIVPIVELLEDGNPGPFLGTGVFVKYSHTLVTARHVVDGVKHGIAIGTVSDQINFFRAKILLEDSDADLVLFEVQDYKAPYALPLARDDEVVLNEFIMAYEYGTTVVAGAHIHFNPANRLGNITRVRDMRSQYGKAGDGMLELSFPALKGASGSPVSRRVFPFQLLGIVVANVDYHLLPVQIERVLDQSGRMDEETRFMMPQALAVHVRHIRELLDKYDAQSKKVE